MSKQFNLIHRWDPNSYYHSPDQSGPGSNGKEGVLHIFQSSWREASSSDFLVSYPVLNNTRTAGFVGMAVWVFHWLHKFFKKQQTTDDGRKNRQTRI